MDGTGDAAQCEDCPVGSSTAGTGATSLNECCKYHSMLLHCIYSQRNTAGI